MDRKTRTTEKSPSRGKTAKRTKSRSGSRTRKVDKPEPRPKSPSRRSPGRKSPARKSPARVKVTTEKISPSPSKFINKINEIVAEVKASITPDRKVEEVIRSSVTRFEEVTNDFVPSVRRSNRLGSRETSTPNSDRLTGKIGSLVQNNVHSSEEVKREFGPLIIPLLLSILIPAVVLVAQLSCTKESCTPIPKKILLTWRRFFDLEAALWYLGYFAIQLILASLPLGVSRKSSGKTDNFPYRCNGPAVVIITSAVLVGLKHYWNFPVTKILDRSLPILTTSILTSFVISIFIYLKALRGKVKRSEFGNTGNSFYDMWAGAEVNPRIGPLDLKTAMLRITLVSATIYNSLLVYREVQGKELEQISINVVLVSALQIIYFLDMMVFESENILTSFFVNHDGLGMFTTHFFAIYPFLITLLPKYLYLSRSNHNIWISVAATLNFLIGYGIFRLSSIQKANFKKSFSTFPSSDIIHSRSSSLYKGGLWGLVRHPNYLGVFIIHFSWCIFVLVSAPLHWVAPGILAMTLVDMLFHIRRVEGRCQLRHGSAWNIYSNQVRYKLIPKVF